MPGKSGLEYTCIGSGTQSSYGCTTAFANARAVVGVTVVSDGEVSGYTTITQSEGGFAAHSIQVRFKGEDPVPMTKVDVVSRASQCFNTDQQDLSWDTCSYRRKPRAFLPRQTHRVQHLPPLPPSASPRSSSRRSNRRRKGRGMASAPPLLSASASDPPSQHSSSPAR